MALEVLYLDTSALVKLVVAEPESEAVLELVSSHRERASSALAATELRRAVRRYSADRTLIERAELLLRGLTLIPLDDALLKRAGELEPATLRSLDAIHLASALYLHDFLAAFVVYDTRLSDAARALELPVAAPGGSAALR